MFEDEVEDDGGMCELKFLEDAEGWVAVARGHRWEGMVEATQLGREGFDVGEVR